MYAAILFLVRVEDQGSQKYAAKGSGTATPLNTVVRSLMVRAMQTAMSSSIV
jgi:hypothetical protein